MLTLDKMIRRHEHKRKKRSSLTRHGQQEDRRSLHHAQRPPHEERRTHLWKSKCCPCSFSGEKTFMMPPMRPADEDEGVDDDGPSLPEPEPSFPRSPSPEGSENP